MWNHNRSVILSSICTKLVILLVIVFAFAAPSMVNYSLGYEEIKDPGVHRSILTAIYACCVPALAALFCLDRLLANIKKKEVFIPRNVRFLRWISWCCFAVSIILFVAAFSTPPTFFFFIVAVAAGFFGLILRVVKNVIEQAMILKDENDLTI